MIFQSFDDDDDEYYYYYSFIHIIPMLRCAEGKSPQQESQ